MVFQNPALLDSLTIFDNIAFGLKAHGVPEPAWDARIRELLELVHLSPDILKRLPPELSFGMQKRVSLARTLAPQPRILLFDEPTTGLDPITTHAINGLIKDLSHTLQTTSVVVSHDMESALHLADRILVLDGGQIAALASPHDLRQSTHPMVREFLRETAPLESKSP